MENTIVLERKFTMILPSFTRRKEWHREWGEKIKNKKQNEAIGRQWEKDRKNKGRDITHKGKRKRIKKINLISEKIENKRREIQRRQRKMILFS